MIYRQMQSADLPEVAALLRGSFSPCLRPYMAYTQHGVASFLAARLEHPRSFPQQFLGVATDETGRVLGYVDFRLSTPTECFLSYVCVSEDARRLGVATALIVHFCGRQASLEGIELDVFVDNASALNLYRRLGFASTEGSTWLLRELPAPSMELKVLQLTTSRAAHTVYGFCEFRVEWEGREIRLGRIGTEVLRCFDRETFGNENLLAGVRATFPDVTQALAIVASGDLDEDNEDEDNEDEDNEKARVLLKSMRMKGSVDTVMGRVSGSA